MLRTGFDEQYRIRLRHDSSGTVRATRFVLLSYFPLMVWLFFLAAQFFNSCAKRVR